MEKLETKVCREKPYCSLVWTHSDAIINRGHLTTDSQRLEFRAVSVNAKFKDMKRKKKHLSSAQRSILPVRIDPTVRCD